MKSNREKCIEMWEWLSEKHGRLKIDFMHTYYPDEVRNNFNSCWACKEAGFSGYEDILYGDIICGNCPIDFKNKTNNSYKCGDENSPYGKWENIICRKNKSSDYYQKKAQKYAKEFLQLIKETWVEDE